MCIIIHANTSITFPQSLNSIGANAFTACYGIKKYDFSSRQTIPTLSNKNAFQNNPTDYVIVVPDSLYDTWIKTTNWSDASIKTHIVKTSNYIDL